MTENVIITVLVPAYNSLDGVVRINRCDWVEKKVTVIDDDDSTDPVVADAIRAYIDGFKHREVTMYTSSMSPTKCGDNWNFLLQRVKTKFYVLVHHDETFSNTLFIDEVEKYQDSLELMVLPVKIEYPDGVYRNVKSSAQSLLIRLFRGRSPVLNFIGGPTALLIIKSTNSFV